MSKQQTLQNEIEESKRWLDRETDESTYKDLQKRIELINWVFEWMILLIIKKLLFIHKISQDFFTVTLSRYLLSAFQPYCVNRCLILLI